MKKIDQIDVSGDVGLKVRGKSKEELFENAAAGMFALITDVSAIRETDQKEITLKAEEDEDTLIRWLNELVFLFDTYGFTGKEFHASFKENTFHAHISGGIFNPEVNEKKLLIKAATYHNLSLKKTGRFWEAMVVFDI